MSSPYSFLETQTARPTILTSSAAHSWPPYSGLSDLRITREGSECGTCSIRFATSAMPSQIRKTPGGESAVRLTSINEVVAA